jgi:hypothetical protein
VRPRDEGTSQPQLSRRSPLAFLGRIKADDWRRALILAEILAPPVARRSSPPTQIHGGEEPPRPL